MRLLPLLVSLTLATTAGASALPGLDPARPMTSYVSTVWHETSGLPVDSVAALAQTPDGFLWIGTEVGLVRFDGVRFTVLTQENTPALRTSWIESLHVARDGRLWIGTHGGGAVTYDGRTFQRVPIPLRLIIGFAEAPDGTIWVGAPGGVARVRGEQYEVFGKTKGYAGGRLRALAADDTGVWLALPEGVLRLGDGAPRRLGARDGVPPPVTSLLHTASGLLAATESGKLVRLAPGASHFAPLPGEVHDAITSILEGREGSLWMSTAGGGIVRWRNGEISRLTEREGLSSNSVTQLAADDEGNLWAATIGGGVVRLRESRVTTVIPDSSIPGEWILPLAEGRDGSVWFTTNGGGLSRLHQGKFSRLTTADGLLSNTITTLAAARDGSIWAGFDEGLQRIAGGRVAETFTAKDGLLMPQVLALTVARDGSVWVSTSKGLHHLQHGRVTRLTEKDGMQPGGILGIREAADGSLWLAKARGVEHFAGGRLTCFARESGLITSLIHSIEIDDRDGSIWVATAGNGLSRIRDGVVRTFRTSDGLLSDTAYGVIQDRDGDLWIPTNLGLSSIRRADLERFEAGLSPRIVARNFRKSDGLRSSDFSGGFDRPGFAAHDGKLWFPTTRGLVVVDPRHARAESASPRVLIEELLVNATPFRKGAPIEVEAGHRNIEIAYTAPTFTAPELIRFRYRLEGYDDHWEEAGTRRTAYFTNVPPGNYLFRVQAENGAGGLRETVLPIRVEPRPQETWLFRAALLLLLLLVVLVVVRRRFDALRRRQAELHASEAHFRSLIENGSDMILVVDASGRLSYVSPSVERALGLAASDLERQPFARLLAEPENASAFLATVSGDGSASALLFFRDAHGVDREVETAGTLTERGTILNCRDVTDRRRLEAQLAQANRVASLGRLAATIAHEFNNVLMGIQPFIEVIQRSRDERTLRKATSQMAQSIQRGKRITEEILRYTRPVEPTLKPLAVRDWLLDLEPELRALVGESVRITIVAPPGIGLHADAGQLGQVFTNLAINARDAGATNLRIDVRTVTGDAILPFGVVRDGQRLAHIRVIDDGGGIPESVLEHIFEPMFTTKTTKGTGLGLAVAEKIVKMHGGRMSAESHVGAGTTFHIFLNALADSGVVTHEEISECRAGAPHCRVLLVEDDAAVGEGLLMLLESDGFEAELAVTGGEALSLIPTVSPDLVILDVGLPDIEGTDLYRQIASRWPEIRVIFSTGHADVAALEESLGTQVVFLQKPYAREALLDAIAAAMEQTAVA